MRLAVTLALVASLTTVLGSTAAVHAAEPVADHLLLSEFLVEPSGDVGEFIEIFNPTNATVDLSDVNRPGFRGGSNL